MNREIKFRGKRVDNGELVYGFYGEALNEKHYIIVSEFSGNFEPNYCYFMDYEVDKETIGQFTGLKDLNNKESFEDDLIKNTRDKEIYKIFWHKYRGQWMCSSKHRTRKLSEVINDAFIIGNIHDNKELINA